jgi:hypothetical protein
MWPVSEEMAWVTPEYGNKRRAMFQILIDGHLDPDWAAWLGDTTISHLADGTTSLTGIPDQAAAYGVLARLQELGASIISLTRAPGEEQKDVG